MSALGCQPIPEEPCAKVTGIRLRLRKMENEQAHLPTKEHSYCPEVGIGFEILPSLAISAVWPA